MEAANRVMVELRRQFEDLASRFMASDQGQRLIEWYEGLGERDRLALRVLGTFATLVLTYLLVVSPLVAQGDKALRFLQGEQEMYAWLKSNEAQAGQIQGAAQSDAAQPIATVVNGAAQEYKLTVRRYEPAGENSVRVWFDAVSFNDLAKWMYQLENGHQIRANQIDIEAAEGAGLVNARVLLSG